MRSMAASSAGKPPSMQRPRSWHHQRAARADRWPSGPGSFSELMDWPTSVVKGLFSSGADEDAEMQLRLEHNLRCGVSLYTDYSGMDCPRWAMEACVVALQRKMGWDLTDCVEFRRSCDNGSLPHSVLVSVAKTLDDSKSCVFSDLADRLPETAQAWVKAASPDDTVSRSEKEYAYKEIANWLHENRSWIFTDKAESWCSVHNQMCLVFASDSKKRLRHESCENDSQADQVETGNDYDEHFSTRRYLLRGSIAGVTCVGWTAEGSGEGLAHSSELPHAIWLQERFCAAQRAEGESFFFGECTPRYPVDAKVTSVLPDHLVLKIIDGPEFHGWPHKRRRVLFAGLVKSRIRWIGPSDYPQDFARRFHKAATLFGDVFLISDKQELLHEYQDLALKQKYIISTAEIAETSPDRLLEMMLPPGAIQRLALWRIVKEQGENDSDPFLADIDHRPNCKGNSGGLDWPVQLTHGTVTNILDDNGWRIATSIEHLVALGFHAKGTESYAMTRVMPILMELKPYQRKQLAGNAMHLLTQAAWMLYILSNIVPIHDAQIPRSVQSTSLETVDSEGDPTEMSK